MPETNVPLSKSKIRFLKFALNTLPASMIFGPGMVLWHFIRPSSANDYFLSAFLMLAIIDLLIVVTGVTTSCPADLENRDEETCME